MTVLARAKHTSIVTLCLAALAVCRPAAADTVSLMWDSNPDQVTGYAVYVGMQSGTYTQRYDVGNATAFAYPAATAGQRYCFAVAAYVTSTESPKSSEVCGFSNAPPSLTNPGERTGIVGQPATLQLVGTDPAGQALTYSATGLPTGLTVMASTGFVSGVGTTAGTYAVTATASDGVLSASQSFLWTMTAAPVLDTAPPTVTIAGPTTAASYETAVSSLALNGTSADNAGTTQVSWANDRGGSGVASGTTNWSVASIALQSGTNLITVQARDAAGNQGSDVIAVTYTPPAPVPTTSVVLGAQVTTTKTKRRVDLGWTQTPWTGVDVYRNGARITTTANDGAYTDSSCKRGRTYTYKICAPGSTVCSNSTTVYF
ncbi:MAG TPA: putative Ig domain-containing protein [Vicinamibacterales bacterium]|nr:putative Ig domain-containing protein [Vicinamibacterales bacterium]